MSEKHSTYGNPPTLPGSTISSEANLESELEGALLVHTFKNYAIFILRCLTVRFMAYLTATENMNGTQK